MLAAGFLVRRHAAVRIRRVLIRLRESYAAERAAIDPGRPGGAGDRKLLARAIESVDSLLGREPQLARLSKGREEGSGIFALVTRIGIPTGVIAAAVQIEGSPLVTRAAELLDFDLPSGEVLLLGTVVTSIALLFITGVGIALFLAADTFAFYAAGSLFWGEYEATFAAGPKPGCANQLENAIFSLLKRRMPRMRNPVAGYAFLYVIAGPLIGWSAITFRPGMFEAIR